MNRIVAEAILRRFSRRFLRLTVNSNVADFDRQEMISFLAFTGFIHV